MVDFAKLITRPNIRPEIQALIDRGNITIEDMRDLRANSYEWESMVPALSTEALIDRTSHAIDNCPRANVPAQSYTEAVHAVFAPELIKRLRAQLTKSQFGADELRALGLKPQHMHGCDYPREMCVCGIGP
jgi:hypothetical protein